MYKNRKLGQVKMRADWLTMWRYARALTSDWLPGRGQECRLTRLPFLPAPCHEMATADRLASFSGPRARGRGRSGGEGGRGRRGRTGAPSHHDIMVRMQN